MGSLEVNKAFAAVLMAGIAFVGAGQLADALVRPHALHETAIKIDGVQTAGAAAPAAAAAPSAPIGVLLASADAGTGETTAKRLCVSCHNFDEGGKNGVGPNLYNVIGAPHGHLANFQYSAALKAKEGPWTYEEMNAWLLNPRGYAPGTKMAFAGIANDKTRADVVLYLRSLSKSPQPLPDATATPAAAQGTAPAATGAGPANAPSADADAAATPRPQPSGESGSTEGGTRSQQGQVVGPTGQGQVRGQSNSTPSLNLNQSQIESNQGQQQAR